MEVVYPPVKFATILNIHDVFTSYILLSCNRLKVKLAALFFCLCPHTALSLPPMPDLVCTSRSAVSIRRGVKAKRRRLTAITQPTTSRLN